MPRTRLLPALALSAAALLAAPSAHADSISYIKDGNVWLASPDGAKTVQVTTSGGYSTTSQADDGRILALKGTRFHLLSRSGDVLADFTPVGSGTAGSITLSGPYSPAISPDGTKVAYGFYVQYKTGGPNCGKPGGCMAGQLYTGTGYAKADGPVDWSTDGFRPQYSWTDPSWIDDTHTLLAGPTSAFVTETAIDTAGDGQAAQEWFSDNLVQNLYDGDMTRQRTAAAFVGNTEGNRLLVYRTPSGVPATPERCLDAPTQSGRWSSPTWSPDGQRLAWAGPQGIYVAELAGLGDACPPASTVKVSAIEPGGSAPDWGPADLPAPRPPATGGGTGAPGPGGAASGPDTAAPQDQASAAITLRALTTSRSAALRRGLRVAVRCQSGKLSVRALLGGTVIARATTTCRGTERTTTLPLTPAGRRRLRASRRPVVELRATGARDVKVTLR